MRLCNIPRTNNDEGHRGSGARFFHFLTALSDGFMAMIPASSVTNLPEISKATAVPALGTILNLEENNSRGQILSQIRLMNRRIKAQFITYSFNFWLEKNRGTIKQDLTVF